MFGNPLKQTLINPYFKEYERGIRSTFYGFLSTVGGFFSLFLGFSLISFIEIFFWFTIKLSRNYSLFIYIYSFKRKEEL